MAIATPPAAPASNKSDLWGGLPIEVIVGTGEFGAGKSVYGLTIDPGPRTLVMDNEGSTTIYQSLGFKHVDMAAELMKKHPKGYTPEDRYLWWREAAIQHGKSGNYTVLMVDPFSEIEAGLARYVEKNPQKFGYSDAQFKRSSGLYWSAVKSVLKSDLDMLRAMYQTVYLVVHMRNEFRGATPTGKREPKGKETLFELASLFLQFERKKNDRGEVPAVPSAIVLKSRLAHTRITDDGVQILPILPPRLPKATPQAIREYIKSPPDYSRLKKDERAPENQLSDDDKLLLQAQIATAQAEAAEAELQREAMRSKALEAQRAALAKQPVAPDQSAEQAEKAEQKAQAAAEVAMVTAEQRELLRKLQADLYGQDFGPLRLLLQQYEAETARDLTEDQAQEVIEALTSELQERMAEKGQQLSAASTAPMVTQEPAAAVDEPLPDDEQAAAAEAEQPSPPGLPPGARVEADGTFTVPVSPERVEEIRGMLKAAHIMPATFAEMLARFGKQKIAELNVGEAAQIVTDLKQRIRRVEEAAASESSAPEAAEAPADPTPGTITNEQFNEINRLAQAVGWPKDKRDAYLASCKVNSFRSLSAEQAQSVITKLSTALKQFEQGAAGGK